MSNKYVNFEKFKQIQGQTNPYFNILNILNFFKKMRRTHYLNKMNSDIDLWYDWW